MQSVNKFDKLRYNVRKAVQMVRGGVKYTWHNGMHHFIFCGPGVKIRNAKFLSIKGKLKLEDGVEIDALSIEGVQFGKNVRLGRYTSMRVSNNINALGKGVVIGNNSSCGDYTFFGCAGGITIGNDVIMGQCVRFHAQNHNFSKLNELIRLQGTTAKGIEIGNNCWIGSGTVFLDGSSIGDGCVIGANSLITKKFPDNCVIYGQPAKVIRYRTEF